MFGLLRAHVSRDKDLFQVFHINSVDLLSSSSVYLFLSLLNTLRSVLELSAGYYYTLITPKRQLQARAPAPRRHDCECDTDSSIYVAYH